MAKKKADKTEAPEVMDASAPEVTTVTDMSKHAPMSARKCYAMRTLIAEVEALYGAVPYDLGSAHRRNVALSVVFADPETDEPVRLDDLLIVLRGDERVRHVLYDTTAGETLVQFRDNVVLMDTATPFGLAEAYEMIAEDDR